MKSPSRSHFVASLLGGAVVAGTLLALGATGHGNTETIIEGSPFAAQPASTAGGRLTAHAIYERDAPGVVFVRAQIIQQVEDPFDLFPSQERSISTGSGFLIDNTGDVLTNYHVIEGANRSNGVSVQFEDNVTRTAVVVDQDPNNDLALLKVNTAGVPEVHPLVLGDSTTVQVGDPTLAIGNPFGLDRTLTSGIVSALQRQIQGPSGFSIDNVIQTDAPINPGNSGGPLLDAGGRVIGINSQIETGGANGNVGIGFAVPSNTVRQVVPRLEQGETVQHPYLGISTAATTSPTATGAPVEQVNPGGPADKGGVQAGDVIIRVGSTQVATPDDVSAAIAAHKPGDVVDVVVQRAGGTVVLHVKLGVQPKTP